MRVPVSWLRDFVETDASPNAFAAALTQRGFEVDAVVEQPTPERIVVGRIETLSRHPNADRLHVSTVDIGKEKLQIVTGATNVAVGDKVPIAVAGSVVYARGGAPGNGAAPETKRIERSSLRGIESNGMMCSPDELALPGEYDDGILIMEEDAPVGGDFWRVARFGDAEERLEDLREHVFGNAVAVIANGDFREFGIGIELHFNRRALGRVADGIPQHVLDAPAQQFAIAA